MNVEELNFASVTPPCARGIIRQSAEDFQVDEQLSFTPEGFGEHVLVQIQKRHCNTDWIAQQLSKFCGVHPLDVSYAGLKDRHALTTQWFSVRLAGKPEPDWNTFRSEEWQVLQSVRHLRKLRRGAIAYNHFCLVIRDVHGQSDALENALQRIQQQGVPNYFGEQRFGYSNLNKAHALFTGQLRKCSAQQRGLYLSAARAFLFNHILSWRVTHQLWNQVVAGDVLQLEGTHSIFKCPSPDTEILRRVEQGDVHPTAPLWGRGENLAQGDALVIEQTVLARYPEWCNGLIAAEMDQERRALRMYPIGLKWCWLDKQSLQVSFSLNTGSYATAVLQAFIDVVDAGVH